MALALGDQLAREHRRPQRGDQLRVQINQQVVNVAVAVGVALGNRHHDRAAGLVVDDQREGGVGVQLAVLRRGIGADDAQIVENAGDRRDQHVLQIEHVAQRRVGKRYRSFHHGRVAERIEKVGEKEINYSNKNIVEYNNVIKEVSGDNGVVFIDIFNLLLKKDLADGSHPNTCGHEKIFEVIKKTLEENYNI